MSKPSKIVAWALVASVMLALGLRYVLHPPLHLQAAELLPEPKPMASYGFTIDGKRVNLDLFHGHWVLVFLGYTSCPDECPLELQKLAQMLKQFSGEDEKHAPVVLFVSLDPERDTQENLKKYVNFFDERIVGVTGKNSELAELAGAFGASYNRTVTLGDQEILIVAGADMPKNSGDHYVVNHSSRIFILDPELRYVGSFPPPHDVATLFSDLQQLIRHGSLP